MDALSGWGQYLKVSLPATAMICAELWAIHTLTFMAGALGVLEVASLTICISMLAILFSVAMGIQEAVCGLIGNCIGANNVPLAMRFFSLTLKVTVTLISVLALGTILARN